MFVVINQARTGIINFNNVSCIAIRKKSIIAYLTGEDGVYIELGKYSDNRLQSVFNNIMYNIDTCTTDETKIYKMPKE